MTVSKGFEWARAELRSLWHIETLRQSIARCAHQAAGTDDPEELQLQRDLLTEYNALQQRLRSAHEIAAQILNADERAVITMRYLEDPHRSWRMIMRELHVSESTCRRLHIQALEEYAYIAKRDSFLE